MKNYYKILIPFIIMLPFMIKSRILNKTVSEITKHNILKSVSHYEVMNEYHFDLYYTNDDEEYINLLKNNCDYYMKLIKNDLAVENFNEKANIILYPNKDNLSLSMGIDYREKPPSGVYYGGIINFLSPKSYLEGDELFQKEYFLREGPIVHEITHYLLDVKTDGNYEKWFSEGISLYFENKYTGFVWREDLDGIAENISFSQMDAYFRDNSQDKSYRASYEQIIKITESYGETALREIFQGLHEGDSFIKTISKYEN